MTHEEKRSVFLEAAAELIEAKGYANTSVEDITNALGLSKGIFYYYWSSKRELISEIHARVLALLNEQLDHILDTTLSPDQRLAKAVKSLVDIVLENKTLVAVLLKELSFPEEISGRRFYTARLQKLFDEGIAAGVVREVDSRILTFLVIGLCRSISLWYQSEGRLSKEEIEEIILQFTTQGYMSTPEGLTLPRESEQLTSIEE
jgi:TetR/AcrR family transcriptional regulator, cholesterol catabolism regulator